MNTYLQYASRNSTIHVLSYGLVTGTTIYHSLVNGPLAYKTLPRQQFGNLQAALTPPVFAIQSICGVTMLSTSLRSATTTYNDLIVGGLVAFSGMLNLFVLGPWTTSIMNRRHKMERATGTKYTDREVSPEMSTINTQFNIAHSLSASVNLVGMFALIAHAVHLGHKLDW